MAAESPRIIVIGACISDFSGYCENIPNRGETVIGHKYFHGCGGKGANQCVTAAKLGASTAFIGKVGNDSLGREYMAEMKKFNIDLTYLKEDATSCTGVGLIMVDKSGENSILAVLGANNKVGPEDVQAAEDVISKGSILLLQQEVPRETNLEAEKIARKYNVMTILNLAPPVPDPVDFTLYDYTIINEVEMETIVGTPVTDIETGKEAVKTAIDKGAKGVVLTLGANGAIWSKSKGEAHHVPADSVDAVDTTGAGDAFVGALATYLAYESSTDIEGAVRWACSVAAISVQKIGTQRSYPTTKELPSNLILSKLEKLL